MPEPTLFGRRLRELRDARGWTQGQLAERARVPPAMISHFETGVRGAPSADNLVKLANALEVSLDYLLGRADQPEIASPRVAAVFRRLGNASAETVDAAIDVVDALVARERRGKTGDDPQRGSDPKKGVRTP